MNYPRATRCPRCRRPLSLMDVDTCHCCGHGLDPDPALADLYLDRDASGADDLDLASLTGFPCHPFSPEVPHHD